MNSDQQPSRARKLCALFSEAARLAVMSVPQYIKDARRLRLHLKERHGAWQAMLTKGILQFALAAGEFGLPVAAAALVTAVGAPPFVAALVAVPGLSLNSMLVQTYHRCQIENRTNLVQAGQVMETQSTVTTERHEVEGLKKNASVMTEAPDDYYWDGYIPKNQTIIQITGMKNFPIDERKAIADKPGIKGVCLPSGGIREVRPVKESAKVYPRTMRPGPGDGSAA
jgi:hypothetical protein